MKMKKMLAVLLSVVLLCSIIPAFSVSAGAGEITNGTFETGDFTGWTYYTYSTSIISSPTQAGSYAVKIGKDSSLAGHVALEQIVPVNTNATYSLTFYNRRYTYAWSGNCSFSVSVELGTSATSFDGTGLSASTPSIGTSFTKRTYSFSTGTYKYARIRFNALGSGVDTALDTIALTATVTGDEGTHAAPALMSFGTEYNRPSSDSNNVIVEPGFEDTTNTSAQWNTSSFLTQGVSVQTDASIAHSGSNYLQYYRGSVDVTTWSMFEITCPTAGEYVFSAWVRTPNLSANNLGKASIGVIDTDTGKFLTYDDDDYYGHYSTPEIQIRSTATDDEWHLRSVTFYVGVANANIKIGMYGLSSKMYVDDISVHLLTNGVKYSGTQTGTLNGSTSVTNKYCESADNLIPDCSMNSEQSEEFWTFAASGWENGFLSFDTDATDSSHGTVLHYKGTNPGSTKLYNYIKWVYVEPNTSYTVSFDYRVASAGNQLMFIDNNIESPQVFHNPTLGSASNSWSTYALTFTSGNYNRIGIVLRDSASAELYLDDFRFFKTEDGISTEPDEEIFPTLKHTGGEKSRMEMDTGKLGLAFRFNLDCTGVTVDGQHIGNYTNGKVQAFEDGVEYTLVAAGAVMTNDATVGQDESVFTRENVNSSATVIDVNAKYLYNTYHKDYVGAPTDGITYAVRITNIPESHASTVIYARPYYVFEYNGKEYTVYGDVSYDSYKALTDVNDGWLEWD